MLIHRAAGRRAEQKLTPHQKRLLFILDTFGKKYPRESADTVMLLGDLTSRYHGSWLGSMSDPVEGARAHILRLRQTWEALPERHALDRHNRWLFEQVRAAWSKSRLPWTRWQVQEEMSMRAGRSKPKVSQAYYAGATPTLWHFSVALRLQEIWGALPEIVEWIENAGGRPSGPWRRVLKEAQAWHTAEIDKALLRAKTLTGLQSGTQVGDLGDGWTLEQLTTAAGMESEGTTMVHCVGNAGYYSRYRRGEIEIYSLRHKGTPKVTFEIVTKSREVKQAKGPHNTAAGLASTNLQQTDLHKIKTPQELGKSADLATLTNVLQIVQTQGWKGLTTTHDLRGAACLLRLLQETAEADARAAQKAQKGRRAHVKKYLSYSDAAKLYAGRPKHKTEGLDVPRLGMWLRKEDRDGTTVYAFWRKRPKTWTLRAQDQADRLIQREVPPALRTRWGREVEQALQRFREGARPIVEIWPDKWVVRGTERDDLPTYVSRYTPMNMKVVNWRGDLPGHWLAYEARPELPIRIRGAAIPPMWALWHVPRARDMSAVVVEIDKEGFPLKISTENVSPEKVGGLLWPRRVWVRKWGKTTLQIKGHTTEDRPGGGFEDIPVVEDDE